MVELIFLGVVLLFIGLLIHFEIALYRYQKEIKKLGFYFHGSSTQIEDLPDAPPEIKRKRFNAEDNARKRDQERERA